ncbi:hypothetical protein ABFS82_11G041100 [Erythranthe guttata]|uniref:Uncharacterized protein n=1 Tax=Erythranthe guttata TaxID=4155 RepID=A0A022R7V1_ERYGU|nr:hypothetical protein MIMGU_mgv1a019005mg [Erythranthe guttata]
MDHEENQEIDSFVPVIPRLDRLDRVLKLLEDEKHSLLSSRRDFCCKTLSSALEEVQHKGTLLERLTALENRVLQLSLEIDQGNTSKSSSSTVEASKDKTVHERSDENSVTAVGQEKQDPPTIQAQEGASYADGFVRSVTAKQEIVRQRKKTRKKWLGLFRLSC